MRPRSRFGQLRFTLSLAALLAAGVYAAGAQRAVLAAADPQAIQPRADSNVRLHRMLLLLQPSAAQAKQLDSLLEAQSTPGKPGYHKWITPAQFASQFAVSPTDAAKVASWLRAQGLTVAPLPASRGWIEFSGTVGQVQTAFGAPVVVAGQGEAGQVRYQLKGTIQLPAEISGLVNGLVSLDGSLSSAASTVPVAIGEGSTASKLAAETSIAKAQQLTPALFANWLQSASLQANGASGSAETGAGETGAGETGRAKQSQSRRAATCAKRISMPFERPLACRLQRSA